MNEDAQYKVIVAQSVGIIDADEIKGGIIKISSNDPKIQQQMDTNFEAALRAFFNVSVGGVAECIRQLEKRGSGDAASLAYSFGALLAEQLKSISGLPGGLLG